MLPHLSSRLSRSALPSTRITVARFSSSFQGPATKKVVTADTKRGNTAIAAVLIAAGGALWYWETSKMGVYAPTQPLNENSEQQPQSTSPGSN